MSSARVSLLLSAPLASELARSGRFMPYTVTRASLARDALRVGVSELREGRPLPSLSPHVVGPVALRSSVVVSGGLRSELELVARGLGLSLSEAVRRVLWLGLCPGGPLSAPTPAPVEGLIFALPL